MPIIAGITHNVIYNTKMFKFIFCIWSSKTNMQCNSQEITSSSIVITRDDSHHGEHVPYSQTKSTHYTCNIVAYNGDSLATNLVTNTIPFLRNQNSSPEIKGLRSWSCQYKLTARDQWTFKVFFVQVQRAHLGIMVLYVTKRNMEQPTFIKSVASSIIF